MSEPRTVSDNRIVDLLREIALEGYETDEEIVRGVAEELSREDPEALDLRARVGRLAPPLFDELHEDEAAWPIPTDNDRLNRAFEALERDGIHTLQHWYDRQETADEEMRHELQAGRQTGRPYRGFAFFHGGDTRRAIAGDGLRITWGAARPRRASKATLALTAWEIAQEIHRALWAQGLSPEWSRVLSEPITVPFTWRRRRKRRPAPAPPPPDLSRIRERLRAFEPPSDVRTLFDLLRDGRPKEP